ncbi:phosphatidylglycerol lysyltransferase domain-containing protein [Bacillus sp. V3-13]|uniref:phosphatidylglycerol lysyltransferase domain-containing protein n=1 Tax=Bacillus sp. V3-13 TaxID=2053728 RepID=UPI0015E0D744|nr:phosphatidylglycerol lysyltransferase domain-containing protein [Bacillus sp. V3-13]
MLLVYILSLLFLIIFSLFMRENRTNGSVQHETDLNEVWSFLEKNGGNHISHLSFLNDKLFYWAKNEQVLLTYQQVGRTYVVLGDPIGKEAFIKDAINEFQQFCSRSGNEAVFYQVSPRFLGDYTNEGYRTVKVGEEARIRMPDFSTVGKKKTRLRTPINKFQRNGYQFAVLFPPHSARLKDELKAVSDSWLGKRKEKGFSVGFFCENYLARFPLAIVTSPDRKIIAFATLACNQQQKNRAITIDLMRYLQDSPSGTMDFLFISIFNWCKEQGYEWCSLGMSPLANLRESEKFNLVESIGQFIYKRGNYFYNFKGLYEYKNKFEPIWESRYLVYKKHTLPIIFVHITRLIHRKRKADIKEAAVTYLKRRITKAG